MSDKKAILFAALGAFMILLLTAIPIAVLFFGGSGPVSPAMPPEDTVPEPLSNIESMEDEMRGLWIATVNNINFPSRMGLSEQELEKELDAIVAFADRNGFNAIMFQVRPAADALYKSDIFPQSRFVSGEGGREADNGFDCLGYILAAAHEKDIAVHAWINPLRVTTGNATYPQTDLSQLPFDSPAVQNPECVFAYGDGKLYFDAGEPFVREMVAAGVREICEGYAVDGIIFDDYFYPYPASNGKIDDADTYLKYGGEFGNIEDFRRDNVNKLVKLCYDTVKSVDSEIDFGVSPFGIWKNSDGENNGSDTRGLEAYSSIYCDALAWVRGGYVDYIAPQLYWSFDTAAAPFGVLADWWNNALEGSGVRLYVNHGVYRYSEGGMVSGELSRQIEYARGLSSYFGGMYYGYAALFENDGGVLDEINTAFEDKIVYFEYPSEN